MSLPPEPDEPTRRLPTTRPAEPLREREVVTTAEPDPRFQEILDRLRSLRTAVALLGVLSLAALGVGLWALLTQEEEGDARRGASQERVSELQDRVEALENETDDAAPQDAVERVREQQRALEARVSEIEEQSEGSAVEDVQGDVRELSDGLEQVGASIEQLDQRVQDLERQAEDAPSP